MKLENLINPLGVFGALVDILMYILMLHLQRLDPPDRWS